MQAEGASHPAGCKCGDPDSGMVDGVQRKGDLRFTLFGFYPVAPLLGWNAGRIGQLILTRLLDHPLERL